MYPILVDLGFTTVHSYGAMGALAFIVGCIVSITRARAIGVAPERMADLIFWTAIAGLFGARLVFGLQNLEQMNTWFDWVNLRAGGLVFYGSVLIGVPVGAYMMYRAKMPFFATWDAIASVLPISHAISRLGCLLAGCCFGLPTTLPWGVTYDHPLAPGPPGTSLHPVQLYEALGLLILGAGLQYLYAHKRWNGQVMAAYLIGYAVVRTLTETLRGDAERGLFLPTIFGDLLSYSQGISFVMAAFGAIVFGLIARQRHQARQAKGAQIHGPTA